MVHKGLLRDSLLFFPNRNRALLLKSSYFVRGIDGSLGRLVDKECCIQHCPHLSSGQEEERKVDSESKPQNRAGDGC